MAFTRSETVAKIIEEFGELRKKDPTISIKEIAEMYGVDKTTIYHVLDEIAEKNGVHRDELLLQPQKKRKANPIVKQNNSEKHHADPQVLISKFDNVISDTRDIVNDIRMAINENKKCVENWEEKI